MSEEKKEIFEENLNRDKATETVEEGNDGLEVELEEENKENTTSEVKEEQKEQEKIEETCEVKILKLELEIQEWKNSYTRKLAEFQNFTKRKENEVLEMKKYASEGIIIKLLDNVDNLERAVAASEETKNFDSLVEGVNMILNNLKHLLKEEEVEAVEVETGTEFNPYEHQAMMTESKEDLDDNVVVQIFQKGYKLKGKVIRPAMVTVNKK